MWWSWCALDYNINASVGEIMQKEGYQTKVMKPEKKKELPIYQKRNHWCFRHEGLLHKYDSKSEAEEKYLELIK